MKTNNIQIIECTSSEGITIGLIDSIMSIAGALRDRDIDETRNVQEALMDLYTNKDLKFLLAEGQNLRDLSSVQDYPI